ncbi:hypothetical protein D918_06578 [Trichuris suis]|nr:hypothetical protein D918_06578 [Trichuris suis]
MPHLFLPRRLKRTFVNEKHSIQDRANEEVLNNWPAQRSDSKSTSFLVANYVDITEQEQETDECRNARQKRLFSSLNGSPLQEESNPVMSLSAVEFNHTSNRHQCSSFKNLAIPASSVLPLVCTENAPAISSSSQSACAKLWETKLNSSITQHRLRATLSSYIRGSFSCYDGDCPDEVPMVSSAIVPQEQSPGLSKPDCLLKAPLSAPCLPQHTTVFDFPSSKVADYRELIVRDGKVVKSKSSSLPCHGSRQRKLSNYVHIDMVATQAARKVRR